MNRTSGLIILIVILSFGCLHAQVKIDVKKLNPQAIRLNDQAMDLSFKFAPSKEQYRDTLKKVIKLLNQAIAIDTNYYVAYHNKMGFLLQLKQHDSCLITMKAIFNKWPEDVSNTTLIGEFYEIKGDSSSANWYYKNAFSMITRVLDSIKNTNRHYERYKILQAKLLILLNEPEKSQAILVALIDKTNNEQNKDMLREYMTMSRHDVLYGKTSIEGNVTHSINW